MQSHTCLNTICYIIHCSRPIFWVHLKQGTVIISGITQNLYIINNNKATFITVRFRRGCCLQHNIQHTADVEITQIPKGVALFFIL